MGDLERRISAQTSILRVYNATKQENFVRQSEAFVKSTAKVLEEYWAAAKAAHDRLITATDATAEVNQAHDQALAQIEAAYLKALTKIQSRLDQITTEQRADAQANNQPMPQGTADSRMVELLESLRLESTKLPRFDGDRNKWLKFYEDFTTYVDGKNYPNSIKMSRLRECLSGPALRVVDGALPADGNTYSGAWKALKERYDNKRFLVNSHLNNIFNFRLAGKNDLMRLVDTFEATIRALGSLAIDTKGWDAILSFILLRKLDDTTRSAWEMQQENSEIPKFDELLAFIKRRANSLDFAQMGSVETRTTDGRSKSSALIHNLTSNGQHDSNCPLCQRNHRVTSCSKLLQIAPNKRFSLVRTVRDLCFNCLQNGHFTQSCSSSNCRHCNGRHHTLLCRSDAASEAYSAAQTKFHTHSKVDQDGLNTAAMAFTPAGASA